VTQVLFPWTESAQVGETAKAEVGVEVLDAADLFSAVNAAIAAAPSTFCGLVLVDHSLQLAGLAPQMRWSGKLVYGERKRKAAGEYEYEFKTSGGSQKVSVSKATIATYPASGITAPTTNQVIGIKDDGSAEGVDIHVPVFEWSETWYYASAIVNDAFVDRLHELTACINDSAFKIAPGATSTAPAGEVLCLGVEGKVRTDTVDWAVTYHFARSRNMSNIVTGPVTVTTKKGWDYVWYHVVTKTSNGKTTMEPDYAKVEKVYEYDDLNDLFPVGYR
jgi:hypothetical protein